MSIQAHIDSLAEKRLRIKEQIAEEVHRPLPDFKVITDLKKENLLLKEEMQRYLSLLSKKTYNASS
jgi:hypothetical protein